MEGNKYEIIELIKMTLGSAAALLFVWGLLNMASLLGGLGLPENFGQERAGALQGMPSAAFNILEYEKFEPPFDPDSQVAYTGD